MNRTYSKKLWQSSLPRMARHWKVFAALAAIAVSAAVWKIQQSGRDPLLVFQKGQEAARKGDTETAFRNARLLLRTAEFESYGHMLRGTLFLEIHQYVAAANEFRLAADDPKMKMEAYTRCGETFYRMHQFVDAEQMLLQALELDPANSDARRWLASTYYDLGAMSLALEQLKIIGEVNPDDGRPFRLSGRIRKDFHHHGEAIEDYREALRRTLPESEKAPVTEELAECLVQQLRYSEALTALQNAKPSAQVSALQAVCYSALGEPEKAISKADEALALNPDLVSAILTRASIEMELGKAENAVELLEKAAAAHPGNFEILFQLVKALRLAGRSSEADARSGRLEELEKLVDEFARLNSSAMTDVGNADLRYQIGQLAQQLDRPDLARTWCEAALAIDPNLTAAKKLLEQLSGPY